MEAFYFTLKIFVFVSTASGIAFIIRGSKKNSFLSVIIGVLLVFPAIVAVILTFIR